MSDTPPNADTPELCKPTVQSPSAGALVAAQATLHPALETALLQPADVHAPQDRFIHRGVLASGGHGTVHAVFDRVLNRDIAVKRLHHTARPALVASFLREARVLASLDHPGIIPVHDYGVDSKKQPYIVMRRIEGEDLARYIGAVGPPRSRADQVKMLGNLRRVCDAVSFAHTHGLLHNDLKPSNLMLGDHGEIYVVDWGNAVPRTRWKRGLPGISGTPGYLSPEQARAESLSPRTDVFGLGACLYAIMVGRTPRSRKPRQAIEEARQGLPIKPPESHSVPASILDLALRAMSPDPTQRPASARAFADELDRIQHGSWMAPTVKLAPGTFVVQHGEKGDRAFIVEDGKLEVLDPAGRRVEQMAPGDVFGELAPLTRGVRTHSVRTLTECTLAVIDGQQLREMLEMGSLGGRFVSALIARLVGPQLAAPAVPGVLPSVGQTHRTV